jgi:Holliday junction resolvase RusA-like endonuclease
VPRVSLLVAGKPAPKGSRVFYGKGRGSRESSVACKPWVEAVAYSARVNSFGGPLEPPYEVHLKFWMPEGKRPKYGWPSSDGDIDKLVRAVLDGLVQGGLLVDDRHVTKLVSEKTFGSPGVSVVVV